MESEKNLTPWQNNTLTGIQQSHKEAGEFEFVNDASNNGTEFKKDVLSGNQRHSASDVTTYRSSDSSDKSAGFPAPDLRSQTRYVRRRGVKTVRWRSCQVGRIVGFV
ncbi:hypothetical protein Hanom_Chr17g01545901 [Helianthus anomalus]